MSSELDAPESGAISLKQLFPHFDHIKLLNFFQSLWKLFPFDKQQVLEEKHCFLLKSQPLHLSGFLIIFKHYGALNWLCLSPARTWYPRPAHLLTCSPLSSCKKGASSELEGPRCDLANHLPCWFSVDFTTSWVMEGLPIWLSPVIEGAFQLSSYVNLFCGFYAVNSLIVRKCASWHIPSIHSDLSRACLLNSGVLEKQHFIHSASGSFVISIIPE